MTKSLGIIKTKLESWILWIKHCNKIPIVERQSWQVNLLAHNEFRFYNGLLKLNSFPKSPPLYSSSIILTLRHQPTKVVGYNTCDLKKWTCSKDILKIIIVARRQSLKMRHSIAILCQKKVPTIHGYMAHGYICV